MNQQLFTPECITHTPGSLYRPSAHEAPVTCCKAAVLYLHCCTKHTEHSAEHKAFALAELSYMYTHVYNVAESCSIMRTTQLKPQPRTCHLCLPRKTHLRPSRRSRPVGDSIRPCMPTVNPLQKTPINRQNTCPTNSGRYIVLHVQKLEPVCESEPQKQSGLPWKPTILKSSSTRKLSRGYGFHRIGE